MHGQLPVLWVEKVVDFFVVDLQVRNPKKKLTIVSLKGRAFSANGCFVDIMNPCRAD
jgi:hypothetical protein